MNINEDDLAIESAVCFVVGVVTLTIMKLYEWMSLLL